MYSMYKDYIVYGFHMRLFSAMLKQEKKVNEICYISLVQQIKNNIFASFFFKLKIHCERCTPFYLF
jgi:hypothetical protein